MQERLQITGDLCEVGVFKGEGLALLSLLKQDTDKLLGFDLFDEDHVEVTEQSLAAFNAEKYSVIKGPDQRHFSRGIRQKNQESDTVFAY